MSVQPFSDFRKRDDDSTEELSPFCGVEKAKVLQEARCFNDAQIDARKCQQVITKLLYLSIQGEIFTRTEITEVFFSVTKLFQSKDSNLRRMVYLIIKEICPTADEVIIVTSSLMKDMNSKIDLYRANSIRVLCCIADAAMLSQIERYLKQAIVDKSDTVSSAALVSATHLTQVDPDIVRRWSSEIQETLNSPSPGVQFHALGLLYEIRKSDRLAVNKLVMQLTRTQIRSPLANCLLIRYVAQVIGDSTYSLEFDAPLTAFLQNSLRHKSEMVVFEAVRAITALRDVSSSQLGSVVTVLQLLLSSPKPSSRFASMRVINHLAVSFPDLVCGCNADIENLISDENKSIATLAVTTLLKTGGETAVDHLLKRIHSFMTEIQDEFKIMIVEAVRVTCIRCAHKYRTLLSFLSTHLREEGGFEYKRSIVHAIIQLLGAIPQAKELSLSHLAEFIEDCEYTVLSCEILHLLGKEAPATSDPGKYLRYIYNRVVLENPSVRAAAVSAMTNIGSRNAYLRERILVLLHRCLFDADDEVRDRASSSIASLENFSSQKSDVFDSHKCQVYERLLLEYCKAPKFEPVDLNHLISDVKEREPPGAVLRHTDVTTQSKASQSNLGSLPGLIEYGEIFKSSGEDDLTEDETEYKVKCLKHVFPRYVVFEFLCKNTIQEQKLTNVSVTMESFMTSGLCEIAVISLDTMPLHNFASSFSVFKLESGKYITDHFTCKLKFVSKEIDPLTGLTEDEGYEDEYLLEDVHLHQKDYIRMIHVLDFNSTWEGYSDCVESDGLFLADGYDTIHSGVQFVCSSLGLLPCSGNVPPNAKSYVLCCAGELPNSQLLLVRVNFTVEPQAGMRASVTCRAPNEEICLSVLESLGARCD